MTEAESFIVRTIRETAAGMPNSLTDVDILDARIDELKIDSVDLFELVMKLEDRFDTRIDDSAAAECVSVRDFLSLVDL